MKPGDVLLFADECSVQQAPTCVKTWAPKGKTPVVKSPGGRKRQQVIGALNPETGAVVSALANNLKTPAFKAFLKGTIRHYKDRGKIFLVLDNAKTHHAKAIQRFLELVSHKLELIFLPPYSPELNPIEQFWKFMRQQVTHNRYYEDFNDLVSEIGEFLVRHKNPSIEVRTRCPLP